MVPYILFLIGMVAVVVLNSAAPVFDFSGAHSLPMGAALISVGAVLAAWGRLLWKRGRGLAVHRHGPYGLSRNPVFLGLAACLLGASVWLGGLSGLAVPAAFIFILHRYCVPGEEVHLRRIYGPAYDEFFRAVPRWI